MAAYAIINAIGRIAHSQSQWEAVDIAKYKISILYKRYDTLRVTLKNNYTKEVGWLSLDDVDTSIPQDKTFKEYGMNYGWIGKNCIVYVEDKMLEQDKYKAFIDYASKINTRFKEENINTISLQQNSSIVALFSLFTPILGLGYMAYKLYSNYSDNKKKIKDQQYGTLINIFFTNGLDKFLGE